MKLSFRELLAIFVVACCSATARGQSPERIIKRYVKASGGRAALARIRSTRFEGRVTDSATGRTGEFSEQLQAPDHIYLEMVWDGQPSVEAFNGKSAWRQDSSGALSTLTGAEALRLETTALFRNDRFLGSKKNKTQLRALGKATVRGRRAAVVEVVSRAKARREVFFDTASGLISEEDTEGPGEKEQLFFADYRPVDGVMEPYHVEFRRAEQTLEIGVNRVSHNLQLAKSLFDFPKPSSALLPDVSALIRQVQKNQKNIDALVENYTFLEEDTETATRSKSKQWSEKVYEVFFLNGEPVRKLVKKDGQELSAEAARKEQGRVEKRIQEYERRRNQKQERSGADEGDVTEAQEGKGEAGISTFLRVDQFTNPRRERFRGHDVVVFDFGPKAGYKARNLGERLVQALVGSVWIDEQARQVARLEARVNGSFKVAGGLVASVQRGSAFVFEQEMVNNEVWLPSSSEVHASARILLLGGLSEDISSRYSAYKKFRVESVVKTAPPISRTGEK